MKLEKFNTAYRDKIAKRICSRKNFLTFSLLACVTSVSAFAAVQNTISETYGRNIDMRLKIAPSVSLLLPQASQRSEIEGIKSARPDLVFEFNEYGVTSSLMNATGNLTQDTFGVQDAESVALEFVNSRTKLLGLAFSDVDSMEITDVVKSISGVTHYYFRQMYRDIPVFNAQLQVHVTENGAVSLVNNAFIPRLAKSIHTHTPQISAEQAIVAAAKYLHINLSDVPVVMQQLGDSRNTTHLLQPELSSKEIAAKLVWMPIAPGNVVPAWNFQFLLDHSWPDITVNAISGELITSFDGISDASYQVYSFPIESPIHTTPAPPSDARTLVVNPENAKASRNGWFNASSTKMKGNNVHACADRDGNNVCDTPEASCSTGPVCNFPINLSADPRDSQSAAIANLFYWNNIVHDVQYQYGFDEQGGNFQENNFALGGTGSDSVKAEAQDNANGRSNCNANFGTPSDGSNPRMQMYTCDRGTPELDGSLDSAVIVHEYGHGISNRQVGGPSNVSCLFNRQQAGEGWSDIHSLIYTAKASDQGTTTRGLGGYLFNLGTTGTIRPQPYSTDPTVNTHTYASINGLAVPHGVGSVWAQALWEMYWALVTQYGFEADLINFDINDLNEAGNKRALFYINEGLKNTACSPTFVNNRDGIIAAATNSFGGADVCTVWKTFAEFGLGVNAVSGGSSSTRPTNGFNLPASCGTNPPTPGNTFENKQSYSIPDNSTTGVSSPITVTRAGASGTVGVLVSITHTYIGDLIVDLIHPDGTVFNVHNRTGGTTANIETTYSVNVGAKDSKGDWKLRVSDRAGADTGSINRWSVTFK